MGGKDETCDRVSHAWTSPESLSEQERTQRFNQLREQLRSKEGAEWKYITEALGYLPKIASFEPAHPLAMYPLSAPVTSPSPGT